MCTHPHIPADKGHGGRVATMGCGLHIQTHICIITCIIYTYIYVYMLYIGSSAICARCATYLFTRTRWSRGYYEVFYTHTHMYYMYYV